MRRLRYLCSEICNCLDILVLLTLEGQKIATNDLYDNDMVSSCLWACLRLVKPILKEVFYWKISLETKRSEGLEATTIEVRGIRGYYYIPTSVRFSSFKLVKKVGKYQTKAKCTSMQNDDRNEANCAHNPRPVRIWLS